MHTWNVRSVLILALSCAGSIPGALGDLNEVKEHWLPFYKLTREREDKMGKSAC